MIKAIYSTGGIAYYQDDLHCIPIIKRQLRSICKRDHIINRAFFPFCEIVKIDKDNNEVQFLGIVTVD